MIFHLHIMKAVESAAIAFVMDIPDSDSQTSSGIYLTVILYNNKNHKTHFFLLVCLSAFLKAQKCHV